MFEGFFGSVMTIVIAVGAMIAAITVPFKMGGAIFGALRGLMSFGAGALRLGVAGSLSDFKGFAKNYEGRGKGFVSGAGKVAEGLHAAMYSPEILMQARARHESKVKNEAMVSAAQNKYLNQGVLGDALVEQRIGEQIKEDGLSDAGYPELTDYLIKARASGDSIKAMAAWDIGLKKFGRSKFIHSFNEKLAQQRQRLQNLHATANGSKEHEAAKKEYQDLLYAIGAIDSKSEKGVFSDDGTLDSSKINEEIVKVDAATGIGSIRPHGQAYSLMMLKNMGAELNLDPGNPNEYGTLKDPNNWQQRYVMKRRTRYDKEAEHAHFNDEARTMVDDGKGGLRVGSRGQIAAAGASSMADVEPQEWNRSINRSAIQKGDDLDDTIAYGILNGDVGMNKIKEFGRMKDEGVEGFRDVLVGDVKDAAGNVVMSKLDRQIERLKPGGDIYNMFIQEKKRAGELMGKAAAVAEAEAVQEAQEKLREATIKMQAFAHLGETQDANAAYNNALKALNPTAAPPPTPTPSKPLDKYSDDDLRSFGI